MKTSFANYFQIVDAAEKLDPASIALAAQVREACAVAEQYATVVGMDKLATKLSKLTHWRQLREIVSNLHSENVGVKLAELTYAVLPIQEVMQTKKAQYEAVLVSVQQAIAEQRALNITYTRTDGITKQYQVLPQEITWLSTDVGDKRAMLAYDSDGKLKTFYISQIRRLEFAQ